MQLYRQTTVYAREAAHFPDGERHTSGGAVRAWYSVLFHLHFGFCNNHQFCWTIAYYNN